MVEALHRQASRGEKGGNEKTCPQAIHKGQCRTGLGPTVPAVDPGQPFPSSPAVSFPRYSPRKTTNSANPGTRPIMTVTLINLTISARAPQTAANRYSNNTARLPSSARTNARHRDDRARHTFADTCSPHGQAENCPRCCRNLYCAGLHCGSTTRSACR